MCNVEIWQTQTAKIIYHPFAVYFRKHLHKMYVLLKTTVLGVIRQALITNQLAMLFTVIVQVDRNLQRDWRFQFSKESILFHVILADILKTTTLPERGYFYASSQMYST